MDTRKLLRGVFILSIAAFANYQVAEAASCTAPKAAWGNGVGTGCTISSGGYVNSMSYPTGGGSGNKYLCMWASASLQPAYADAFGYNSLGVRQTSCNPVYAGSYLCDTTGCNSSVTHDVFGSWL